MATRAPAELTLSLMRELMDDVILVDEDEMKLAAGLILQQTHNLAEGAGAAAVAAVLECRPRFEGSNVVAVLSGGNPDLAKYNEIASFGLGEDGLLLRKRE